MNQLFIQNCNVIDLKNGKVLQDVNILIQNSTIVRITEKSFDEGNIINLRGSYVIPGLINVHNNLSIAFPFSEVNPMEPETVTAFRFYNRALKAMYNGITALRTVGEINRVDISVRNLINKGIVDGPTIFASGKGLGSTGGHGSGFGMIEADGPFEFLKFARRELALGADHLKIFITGGIAKSEEDLVNLQMTDEEIRAVVSAAKARGTYVAAHAGGADAIITAVEAGVRCIEHGYILNRKAVEVMKTNKCYLVPTLSVTRSPEWMRENGFEEWTIKKALSIKNKHSESFLQAFHEGVAIVCGTDLPPADLNDGVNATVRELEFMVELGISPLEALRSATINAAELCYAKNRLGSVEEGYQADLIAIPKNPLKNIKSLENIEMVICRGRLIRYEPQH